MTIPKITPYSGGVANPDGSQTQAEFTQNMFDQLSYEAELSTELNNTIDGINDTSTQVDVNATSAAQSAAAAEAAVSGLNYQGLWPGTGGSADKGDTYQTQVSGTPTGKYFTALQNTTVDPVGDDVNWREVVSNQSMGGFTNYQAASVADMIAGKPSGAPAVSHEVGNTWSVKGTDFEMTSISNPVVAGDFSALNDVYADAFGAKAGADSGAAIQAADDYCSSGGYCLAFLRQDYLSSIKLVFNSRVVKFNGCSIERTNNTPGEIAVTLNSKSTNDNAMTDYGKLILKNRDSTEPDIVTNVVSVAIPSANPGANVASIGGSTAPTVTVPFSGATVGSMVTTEATLSSERVQLTCQVITDNEILVHVNNWDQQVAYAGESVNVTFNVMRNPIHGICFSGVFISGDFRVSGFTGVSAVCGGGIDPVSGVNPPDAADGKIYYSDFKINIASGFGYGLNIAPRNNANTIRLSTFPFNLYGDSVPRRHCNIHQLYVQGLNNHFPNLSLESTASKQSFVIGDWCAGVTFDLYYETNTSWEAADPIAVFCASTSTSTKGRAKLTFGHYIEDKGVANDIDRIESNYVGATAKPVKASGSSLIYNGDFEAFTDGWSNFGTNTTPTSIDAPIGKALRYELTNETINLSQNVRSLADSNLTVGAFIRTDIAGISVRVNARTNDSPTRGTGEWEFISSTSLTDATRAMQIRTATASTGYVEVMLATANMGITPIGVPKRTEVESKVTRTISNIPANGSVTEDVTIIGSAATSNYIANIAESAQGAVIFANYQAADTVRVVFANPTGSAITSIGQCDIHVREVKSERYSPR